MRPLKIAKEVFYGVEDIQYYFEKVENAAKTTQELFLHLEKPEMQSAEKIETWLKGLYHLEYKKFKLIVSTALSRRRELLNSVFEFSLKNVENLIRVNDILTENSQKVVNQAEKIQLELRKQIKNNPDGFLQDFEIKGTVNICYNGNDSLLGFDPKHDEDENSDKPHIAQILDEMKEQPLYECHFSIKDRSHSFPMFCTGHWNAQLQSRPELKEITFCWAFHNLADHTSYALQDIVRINDFWNEVTVEYQNFEGNERKS